MTWLLALFKGGGIVSKVWKWRRWIGTAILILGAVLGWQYVRELQSRITVLDAEKAVLQVDLQQAVNSARTNLEAYHRARKDAEIAAAAQAEIHRAQLERARKSAKTKTEIKNAAETEDRPVGPLLRRAFDSLRQP